MGIPLRIHCDWEQEFENNLWKDNIYKIKLTFSTVNHPQSNGLLERFHTTFTKIKRAHKLENSCILCPALSFIIITKNKIHDFIPYEKIVGHTSGSHPEKMFLAPMETGGTFKLYWKVVKTLSFYLYFNRSRYPGLVV